MEREAVIRLIGKAEGSEGDVIDLTSIGKVYADGETYRVEYDESEISGMEGSVSKILITKDTVTLSRMGTYVSTMAFVEGRELPAEIVTPYGLMKMNIFTDSIDFKASDNQINLYLSYAFSIGGERVKNNLSLSCVFR